MQKVIDIKLKENKSKKYKNGTVWSSNNFGDFKIVGKINRSHYLIEFEDGTQIIAYGGAIGTKIVKNPYYPYIFGVACIGKISQYHILYKRWEGMLRRILDKNNRAYKDYGGRGITIDNELLCFESYVEYISSLKNYDKLLSNSKLFDIDRINNNSNYEKGNLRIVTKTENQRNSRNNVIIQMIKNNEVIDTDIIIRLVEKYPEYNFTHCGISAVHTGIQKSHRGFVFKKL